MAKYKLDTADDFEFDLIGICSNNSDYRLCWNINQCLAITLSKGDDYICVSKKDGDSAHSFYQFVDPNGQSEFYLIKNLSSTYKHLIPEKDQIDYFLLLKNNFERELDDILTQLKTNESILTAFIFDPEELKSKGNLLF